MVSSVKERQRALLETVGTAGTGVGIGETAKFSLPLLARIRCSGNSAIADICARFREHCAQMRAGVSMGVEDATGDIEVPENVEILDHVADLQTHEL